MEEKDLQYLALVIMQLHIQIGRLQQQVADLQQQLAAPRKRAKKEASDGVV